MDAYVDKAIEGALADMLLAPSGQDTAINTAAITLAGMVKGWGLPEDTVKTQFFNACRSLPNIRAGDPWTDKHFEAKWRRGMQAASPRPQPNGRVHSRAYSNGRASGVHVPVNGHVIPSAPKDRPPALTGVPLPLATPQKDGRPHRGGLNKDEPPSPRGELRRHNYWRDGEFVRVKIKRMPGCIPPWMDFYKVRLPDGDTVWQDVMPLEYTHVPYMSDQSALDERPGGLLCITEGEKDCDSLAALRVPAITLGASSHRMLPFPELATRSVIVCGDSDKAGRAFVQAQAALLFGHVRDVRTHVFDGPFDGYDLTDFIEQNDAAALNKLIGKILKRAAWAPPLPEPASPYKFQLLPFGKITPVTDVPWLIKNLMPATGLAVVYGAPSSGKSALVLDAMLHVATNRAWMGRRVSQGGVVYIAAESGSGVRNRVYAMAQRLGIDSAPFGVVGVAPSLGVQQGDARQLIEEITAQAPLLAEKPVCIVIDTLARTMSGADENSSRDMGVFVANAEAISRAFACVCIIVHHSGKDAEKAARGSNALLGAVEAEWVITVEEDARKATVTKMKDGPDDWQWAFKIEGDVIGQDRDGDDVTVAVVEKIADAKRSKEFAKRSVKKTSDAGDRALEDAACDALCDAVSYQIFNGPWVRAVDKEAVRRLFYQKYAVAETDPKKRQEVLKKAFQRALDRRKTCYRTECIDGDTTMFWRL